MVDWPAPDEVHLVLESVVDVEDNPLLLGLLLLLSMGRQQRWERTPLPKCLSQPLLCKDLPQPLAG
jgi:hypothetical protein